MKIISWNVNGIRAAVKKGFLDWLAQTSPDVVCLQETKAHPDQVDPHVAHPEGYHAFWHPARRKGYSGVATFTKKKPREVHWKMGIERFDVEGRYLRHEFPQFDLLNIYFPNGTSGDERLQYKLDYYDAFLEHCEALRAEGRELVICGDVNTAHKAIDLKNPRQNEKNSGFLPIERAWMDKFVAHGYIDTFREFNQEPDQYSWWTYRANARERNIGWRLDYFFVTEGLLKRVKDAFITPEVMGSDHCPVGLVITG
ncbi:MAG: exodeoxyribonuclease III [Nitrospinaceae bacterium]|nr:exodeoxyribonuclease III [Nitrospinaceae bacterium]NIR57774.1 exodeoxyribonuclease III [Nitrospinaceae bacterium]NIS88236.1 exodeoxyribonuclease III [Nitrospinaceae bacterium]NIT85116.1 exodeoxyribonuclease III [Nitrospinaceae bacterium]NIU47273.1 exodeoxyribonuclease III [Nitrospinaceae bacterium]